jgi:hypothetical protein
MHPGTVGVEDSRDLDREAMLPMIIEEQGLRAALSFIIARPGADRIDVSPIRLGLRVNGWIAVDLARRSLQNAASKPFGEAEHVDCAMNRRLGRLNRIVLVVNWRSRTGEIVNLIALDVERKCHIVTHEFETRVRMKVLQIPLCASEQIVDTEHLVTLLQQPINEMGSKKAGASGYEDTLATIVEAGH